MLAHASGPFSCLSLLRWSLASLLRGDGNSPRLQELHRAAPNGFAFGDAVTFLQQFERRFQFVGQSEAVEAHGRSVYTRSTEYKQKVSGIRESLQWNVRSLRLSPLPQNGPTMTFRLGIASGLMVLAAAIHVGGSGQAPPQSPEARLLDYIERFTGPRPLDCRLSERPTPQTWANTLACIEDAKTNGKPVYTYGTGVGQVSDAWIVYGFLTTPKGEGYRFSYVESFGMVPDAVPAAGRFEITRCENPRLNGRGLGADIVMCDRPKP